MPNGLRIEHLCGIIPKAQSWEVLSLPVFMFVYIHFNVPPATITDLVRNVSDKKIYWYGTVTFVYVFAIFNLVCVQSVIQLMNAPFITFAETKFGAKYSNTCATKYASWQARTNNSFKVSSQSRKSEFKIFSIVHLNIYNF